MRRIETWTGKTRVLLACAAMLFPGCARERATVTVGTDGTWTRRTVYVITNIGGEAAGPTANGPKAPEVSDWFALPSGEGWKLKYENRKDEKRVLAERTFKLGETLENDIVVKETPKTSLPGVAPANPDVNGEKADQPPVPRKTLTTNIVTVRQVSPGRYVYTETIHWTGEPPTSMHKLDEKELALVRNALPAALASDENVKFVADALSKEFDLALVGPPTPLIHRMPMLMSAPEVFVRLILRRAGKGLMVALKEKFGEQMTQEQRRMIIAQLISGITDEIRTSGPSQAGEAQNSADNKSSSGASIAVSVRMPGRVVETNGIADSFTGDVSWSFYPEAAAFGDVTLTTTCDTASRTAAR